MLPKIKINGSITFFAKLLLGIQDLLNVNKFLTHFICIERPHSKNICVKPFSESNYKLKRSRLQV